MKSDILFIDIFGVLKSMGHPEFIRREDATDNL